MITYYLLLTTYPYAPDPKKVPVVTFTITWSPPAKSISATSLVSAVSYDDPPLPNTVVVPELTMRSRLFTS